LNILLLEPYFTGSHRSWAEEYKKYSKHDITILSLPGRFWKWRMHGGAVTLAKEFTKFDKSFDLILATDMLDLTTFLSLTRKMTSHIPTAIYFHENQLSYPWSPDDRDIIEKRDKHYRFINYSSALTADHCFFNSEYHRKSFLSELPKLLKHFPDFNELDSIEEIETKSSVLYLGLDLKRFDKFKSRQNEIPIILWNHRWEFDKNPKDFFNLLNRLIANKLDFKVVILGENFSEAPHEFRNNIDKLGDKILHTGYVDSSEEYADWLWKSDILPVTNIQDFFGAGIMEAVYCGCYPILPHRLTYPELFPTETFYLDENELFDKTVFALKNIETIRESSLQKTALKFDWSGMAPTYDAEMESVRKIFTVP
jgi:glycosyltransferase involved in cell wall biosynthesis